MAAAIDDLQEFRRRGYPDDTSRAVVADRRELNTPERSALYRGVLSPEASRFRRSRLVAIDGGDARLSVLADGHNVVYTVANYLLGVPLYVATDGLLRDTGEIHGNPLPARIAKRSIGLVWRALDALPAVQAAEIFLDRPLEGNGGIGEELDRTNPDPARFLVSIVPSADRALVDRSRDAGIGHVIATSDGGIIDRTDAPVFDLARFLLDRRYAPRWLLLSQCGDGATDR